MSLVADAPLSGPRIKRDKDAVSEACERTRAIEDAVSRRSSARSELFDLVEAYLYRGLAAEDGHEHLEPGGVVVDL